MTKIFKTRNLVIFATIALIAVLFYFVTNRWTDSGIPGSDGNTTASDGTQFSGPTEQELKDSDARKQDLVNDGNTRPDSTDKRTVSPVITSANSSEVRGFVSGVVEDGGSCTVTYSKGGTNFSKSSTGSTNASNTICGVIQTTQSDFSSSGSWSVVLSYTSKTSTGTSASTAIEVQ